MKEFDAMALFRLSVLGPLVSLAKILDRASYAALAGRIQVRVQLKPVIEPYKSLSAVARQITGTQWNGPLFFGLRQGRGEIV